MTAHHEATLSAEFLNRSGRVGVVGLGTVGRETALALAHAGFQVSGVDVDAAKVASVNAESSRTNGNARADWSRLRATTDPRVLRSVDGVVICVPTPLTQQGDADLSFVRAATASVAAQLHHGMLVVLESTCPPGTTRGVVLPALEATGLKAGTDFHLAFAPERLDPGNATFTMRNTPRLVGGLTPACTTVAAALFGQIVDSVVPVSAPEIAEMAKLVENGFRFVNISFINEIALLCERLGINVWEVVDAAATKPFAFLPHYPSAGIGGRCIPVVPLYLAAAAREHGLNSHLIDAATCINEEMPALVVRKIEEALAARGRALPGARILVVGVTYKPNVADVRGAAALRVMELLARRQADVQFSDPLVERVTVAGRVYDVCPLDPVFVGQQDCVVLLAVHRSVDVDTLITHASLVVDTRDGRRDEPSERVVNVWRSRPPGVLDIQTKPVRARHRRQHDPSDASDHSARP